jgi:hypothetical protein
MTLRLQSSERFDDFALFDTVTGKTEFYSKKTDPEMANRPLSGSYCRLGNMLLKLYRISDVLYFAVDDQVVELTDATSVELEKERSNRTLSVYRGGQCVLECNYQRPSSGTLLEFDPTPFVEEEHFDFGLFVKNVASNPERRERIYRHEAGS